MKILMIDDTPNRALALWNNHLLHRDITVADGYDQINFYLNAFKYDLILLDHDMKMGGIDVCNQFLIQRTIPVIIISTNTQGATNMLHLLKGYEVPVCCCPITSPRKIVDMIKLKELHGMSYSG